MSLNFDIKINNNNSFKIVSIPPNSATEEKHRLILLEKIETIFCMGLKYDPTVEDGFSEDPIAFLQGQVQFLRYPANRVRSIFSRIFKTKYQAEVEKSYQRVIGTHLMMLPKDVISNNLLGRFNLQELGALAQTNKRMNQLVQNFICPLQIFKKFGYDGQDYSEGAEYLKDLLKEVQYRLAPGKLSKTTHISNIKSGIEKLNALKDNVDIELLIHLYALPSEKLSRYVSMILCNLDINKWEPKYVSIALRTATNSGDEKLVEALLRQGAEPNPINLSKTQNLGMIKLYLQYGANIDEVSQYELGRAITNNRIDILKLLLENGADPDSHVRWAVVEFLLHLAATEHNFEAVKLLLEYGANPNIRNSKGKTVLDYSGDITQPRYYDLEIANLALNYGAQNIAGG